MKSNGIAERARACALPSYPRSVGLMQGWSKLWYLGWEGRERFFLTLSGGKVGVANPKYRESRLVRGGPFHYCLEDENAY